MNIKAFCLAVVAWQLIWLYESSCLDPSKQSTLAPDADVTETTDLDAEAAALEDAKSANLQEMAEEQEEKEEEERAKATPPPEKPRAPFALGFTFRSRRKADRTNARFAQIKDNQFNYLLIPDTQKYCEGSSILLAANAPRLGVTSLQTAEQTCNETAECSFFSFAGVETNNDANPGAAWLCSGDEWLTAVPKTSWVTAVKPEYLQSLTPNYALKVNSQVVCDGSNRIGEARGPTSPSAAARTCDSDARCSYFSMYFGGHSSIPTGPRGQIVYYCTGSPTNSAPANGWVFAARLTLTKESTDINPETGLPFGLPMVVRPAAPGATVRNTRGPVTQDSYYDAQAKGAIVPPIKMS